MNQTLSISGHALKTGDTILRNGSDEPYPAYGPITQLHRRSNSYLVDFEQDDERRRIDFDAELKISRPRTPKRRKGVVTSNVRTHTSQEKFLARARLIEQVRSAEFEFTRHPTHLNAATLAAKRAAITQLELELVDLDLSGEA